MKLSFFAAALLGVATVHAVTLNTENEYEAIFDQYYAQVSAEAHGEGDAEAESQPTAQPKVWTDADCEQIVNGMTVRLQIPECMPKPNTDQLIMSAVGELGAKANELNQALQLAFARNQRLAASKQMSIAGTLTITPKIDEPELPPRTTNLNLTVGSAPTATVALAPADPAAPATPATPAVTPATPAK